MAIHFVRKKKRASESRDEQIDRHTHTHPKQKRVNLKMDETSIKPTSNAPRRKNVRKELFDWFAKNLINTLNLPLSPSSVSECEK